MKSIFEYLLSKNKRNQELLKIDMSYEEVIENVFYNYDIIKKSFNDFIGSNPKEHELYIVDDLKVNDKIIMKVKLEDIVYTFNFDVINKEIIYIYIRRQNSESRCMTKQEIEKAINEINSML